MFYDNVAKTLNYTAIGPTQRTIKTCNVNSTTITAGQIGINLVKKSTAFPSNPTYTFPYLSVYNPGQPQQRGVGLLGTGEAATNVDGAVRINNANGNIYVALGAQWYTAETAVLDIYLTMPNGANAVQTTVTVGGQSFTGVAAYPEVFLGRVVVAKSSATAVAAFNVRNQNSTANVNTSAGGHYKVSVQAAYLNSGSITTGSVGTGPTYAYTGSPQVLDTGTLGASAYFYKYFPYTSGDLNSKIQAAVQAAAAGTAFAQTFTIKQITVGSFNAGTGGVYDYTGSTGNQAVSIDVQYKTPDTNTAYTVSLGMGLVNITTSGRFQFNAESVAQPELTDDTTNNRFVVNARPRVVFSAAGPATLSYSSFQTVVTGDTRTVTEYSAITSAVVD